MSARIAGCLLLVLLVGACAPSAAPVAKQKFVLAVQPTMATTDILEKAKPIEQFLESKMTDVDVEIYVPMTQAGIIEALRYGQAHAAFMGAWPAQLAVDLAGAELALAEMREVIIDTTKTEAPYYFSYWVVKKESSAQSLKDLQGKKACFPSLISTSGYVAPMGRLVELGFVTRADKTEADPSKFFSEVRFGGGYAQCWEALKAGQVDVSIIAGDVAEKLYNEVLAATRVVEKQGPVPSHSLIVSKNLKDPLRTQAIDAVAALGAPDKRDLMRGFISSIFVGFQKSDAKTHLGPLKNYLTQSGLAFGEKLGQ